MNPIAQDLNKVIKESNIHVYEMLSEVGKKLFFPKGILSQSAEAKEKAYKFNATIGMATEKGQTMYLPSVMTMINTLEPQEALTYAPSFGIMPIRLEWQKGMKEKNPSLQGKSTSLPVVTHAITHGLSIVADMWLEPDDVIISPDKMWGNYNMIFTVRRGAQIVHYPLFTQQGGFNLEAFENCIKSESQTKKKIVVLLNFPNNPTGYTPTPEEVDRIGDFLTQQAQNGTNVLAIADDAYFGLVYEHKAVKESIFPRLMDRDPRLFAIKLDGATKENFAWGLRVGFITYGGVFSGDPGGPYDALEKKTAGCVRGSISNAAHLSQQVVLKCLQSSSFNKEREKKFEIMMARALEIKKVLADQKYAAVFEAYPFNSGYFMCLKLKTIEAEPLRVHLLEKYGVGLISMGKTDLRVAFSCLEKEDIQEMFDLIFQGVKDLEK